MAALTRVCKDPVEVIRAGRLLDPREKEGRFDAELLEQAAPRLQWLVEQRAPIEVEQVEDHEHHRNFASELIRHPLATQAVLQLEESQHLAIAVREHLAIEQDSVTVTWRRFSQLGKGARGFFQVPREELDAAVVVVKLAANTVVLLLGPHLLRTHPGESFACRLDRACEHEANRLEQRDCRRFELTSLASDRGLSDVTGDEMDLLDLGYRQVERRR